MDSRIPREPPDEADRHLRDTAYDLNRSRLFDALATVGHHARQSGTPYALALASVNGLETVNARLGGDIGDELITAAGLLLRSSLDEHDKVYRYGSNTFAVLFGDCARTTLEQKCNRLADLIGNAAFPTAAGPVAVSLAIGAVAFSAAETHTPSEAIANAQDALQHAKRRPQGNVVLHRPEMTAERADQRHRPISGLVMGALEENRLSLLLQPIVDVVTAKPALFEGLLRLAQPDGTLVPAADFIEEVEHLGLARRIDKRVLELGLALLAEHPRLRLSLNVSSRTAGDKEWMATLRDMASRKDVTRRLTIEITETAMVYDLDTVTSFVETLRSLGCRTAIDDFGSGYASFRYLKALPIDMLKIDGTFVSGLPNDHQGRVLVKAMIEMATALGLETVAEWVTSEEARDFLRAAGVTYIQGFRYGAPMSVDELKQQGLL